MGGRRVIRGPGLALVCEGCDAEVQQPLGPATRELTCRACGRAHPLQTFEVPPGSAPVSRCLRCDCARLYLQKDFNRRIGLWIFAIAALLSVPTWGLSLLVATLVDLVLYAMLPEVTLCYNCGAQHRGFPRNPEHGAYDLHVAEIVARGPRAA